MNKINYIMATAFGESNYRKSNKNDQTTSLNSYLDSYAFMESQVFVSKINALHNRRRIMNHIAKGESTETVATENNGESKFKNFFKKILDAIKNIINKIIEFFKKVFKSNEKIEEKMDEIQEIVTQQKDIKLIPIIEPKNVAGNTENAENIGSTGSTGNGEKPYRVLVIPMTPEGFFRAMMEFYATCYSFNEIISKTLGNNEETKEETKPYQVDFIRIAQNVPAVYQKNLPMIIKNVEQSANYIFKVSNEAENMLKKYNDVTKDTIAKDMSKEEMITYIKNLLEARQAFLEKLSKTPLFKGQKNAIVNHKTIDGILVNMFDNLKNVVGTVSSGLSNIEISNKLQGVFQKINTVSTTMSKLYVGFTKIYTKTASSFVKYFKPKKQKVEPAEEVNG